MSKNILFTEYQLGKITLKNRIAMAPMTRCRATGNIPNELMAEYYAQRASGGLLITEGVAPSPNGCGYTRIPGAWSAEQTEGWKLVADAVHKAGGRIFMQLMHCGRITHPENLPAGAETIAPSAVQAAGEMYTDSQGMQSHPTPREMTLEDIQSTQEEYVQASKNAIAAGFDGVELHGANGYLIDQFINTASNKRTDAYGGSIENRSRFALEVAQKVADAIGKDKLGIRFSPYGVFNDQEVFDSIDDTYEYLAKELNKTGILYIHVVDHSSMGAPPVADSVKQKIRTNFSGAYMLSGGYTTSERASQDLEANKGELVAFGRPFISNPDLVTKLKTNAPLTAPDFDTFYTPGEKGYTDYAVTG